MKYKLKILISVLSVVMLLNACSKNGINDNNKQAQLTPTEQALLGKWRWVKTEKHDSQGILTTVNYEGGNSDHYHPPGSTTNGIFTYSYAELLEDPMYPDLDSSYRSMEYHYYKANFDYNGTPSNLLWLYRPNWGNSGYNHISLMGVISIGTGYIFTLTTTELIIRNNIRQDLKGTEIYYWEKM